MASAAWVIIWQFKVSPISQSIFEQYYGQDGEWVQLFRQHPGYLWSKLYQDVQEKNTYLTCDYWRSLKSYKEFKEQFRQPYQELDIYCEKLTTAEALIMETMTNIDLSFM